jgi:hypothetical protein
VIVVRSLVVAVTCAVAGALQAACGSSPAPAPTADKVTPTVVGEMSPEEAGGMAPDAAAEGGGHHDHAAPHGGTLVELGNEFAHLELVVDTATGALTAYVLDGGAENAVRIAAPTIALELTPAGGSPAAVTLSAKANTLSGETVGDTSQFAGTAPAMKGVTQYAAVLRSLTVRGQTFENIDFVGPDPH